MKNKFKLVRLLWKLYKCPYNEDMMWIWNNIIETKRKILDIKGGNSVG